MPQPSLQINDLVQVRIPEGELRESYPSRVENLRGDEVVIGWPTDKGIPLPIAVEQILRLSFAREGKYYGFEGVVIETALTPVPVIVIRVPVSPDRIERRDNLRVSVPVPVELTEKVVSLSEFRAFGEHNVIRTSTDNISGGGFTIHHRTPIPVGTVFDVKMLLPDNKDPFSVKAKVVRCKEAAGGSQFQLAFAYAQISEKLRSRIVRFVFAAQISEMHPRH